MVNYMITGYQVRTMVNGEEVLVLYIHLDEEFSLEWFHELKEEGFQNFIKNHRIFWNGTKVFLVVGGITLAVLQYQSPKSGEVQYISDALLSPLVIETNQKKLLLPEGKVEVPVQQEEKKQETSESKTYNVETSKKDTVSTNAKKSPVKKENHSSSSTVQNNVSSSVEKPEASVPVTPTVPPKEEVQDTTQYVTVYRSNGQVLKISATEYLIGVVAAEMPASFQMDALKAQSILARTYMMKAMSSGKKLTDTVATQRYIDTSEMKKMWGTSYSSYYQKIQTAVSSTKDLVITYQGNLIDAVYHSTSNGKTEDSENVWGNAFPYLKSVDSSWDKSASSYFRSTQIAKAEFMKTFGLSEEAYSVQILSRNASGRVSLVQVGGETYSGVEFRNKLGLRSADFDVTLTDTFVQIDTRGYGHGVGLSQYGANGMAKEGYTFVQILKHYYNGIEIVSMI